MSEKRIPMLPNQSHLQIELTPEAYESLWPPEKDYRDSGLQIQTTPDHPYRRSLPRYLIARCPFCGREYQENLDTYTLHFWRPATYGEHVFGKGVDDPTRCEHFVRVQHFIHLNRTDPYEVERLWRCDEVPNVMLPFLPDEIESYGIMHALPICRIEADRFVPHYTLYMITYYSAVEDIESLRDSGRKQCPWSFVCRPLNSPNTDPRWWDLNYWVRTGRLHWLTPDHPQLPLQKGPPTAFPYDNIYVPPGAFNASGPGKQYSHRNDFSYSYAQRA
jgi:hypothetical protein